MLLIRREWIRLLLFFFCGMVFSTFAASEIVLTNDLDYFNPFAFGVKYDLSFRNTEKEAVWDITYTILENKTQKVVHTDNFRNITFKQRRGAFYFFVNSDNKVCRTIVCIVGDQNEKQNGINVNGKLNSHCLTLPLQIVLPVGKKRRIFTIKPTSMEVNTFPKGYTQSIFSGNGIQEVDWTFLLEFHKKSSCLSRKKAFLQFGND